VGQLVRVRTTHSDSIRAAQDELLNRLRLLLRVLLVWRAPINFDLDVVFRAEVFRGLLRADARRLENRIALRLRDKTDGVFVFGKRLLHEGKRDCEQTEKKFVKFHRLLKRFLDETVQKREAENKSANCYQDSPAQR